MVVSFLSGSGSGEGEYFGPVGRSDNAINFTYSHQWNNALSRDLDLRSAYEVGQWRSDTDAPYTEQPIGFAELDNRDLQSDRMMASVSSWRELEREDLLDEIAEDIAQLDNDEFHAGFERTAATRRSK